MIHRRRKNDPGQAARLRNDRPIAQGATLLVCLQNNGESGEFETTANLMGPVRSAIEASDFGQEGENARFMVEVAAFRG
jgi:hypothetical protein